MFAVTKFESNNDADTVCKELFSNGARYSKKKEKVKHGKVEKKTKKKKLKNEGKMKDEIKNILNTDFPVNGVKKIKSKKRKTSQNKEVKGPNNQQTNRVSTATKELPSEAVNKKRKKKRKKKKPEDKEASTTEPSPKKMKHAVTANKQDNLEEKQTKKKKNKKKHWLETITSETSPQENPQSSIDNSNKKKRKKLKQKLQEAPISQPSSKKQTKNLTLRQRMMAKLQAARFRYLNEQIYSSDSKEAQKIFNEDPEAFTAYHEGYRQQVGKWPLNPVDVIIKSIQKLPKSHIIADFGCGDAKIARSVSQKVHSFDLVAANEMVVACDMAHVSLQSSSVDVVVFCLSLMGTNIQDYLLEANRVLKPEGILKIAEVESRFDDVNQFIEALKRFNFKNTWTDLSHNLFYFLDFKKEANIKNKKKLPTVSLHPCLYKKR